MISAFLVPADDRELLMLDVAGRPAADHLRELIGASDAITLVDSPAAARGRLVLLDERAWMDASAFRGLTADLSWVAAPTRVVDPRGRTLMMAMAAPADAPTGQALRQMLSAPPGPADVIRAIADVAGGDAGLLDSLEELASHEERILLGRARTALAAGVRVRDPRSVHIRGTLACGEHVEIDVHVVIEGIVTLGDGVSVGPGCILRDVTVGARTRVQPFSLLEQCTVGAESLIGPYARLRPGSHLGNRIQIGNFVEIKNSRIGDGSRINHHSFIGDATLAEGVTIGAGTITCNHDGVGTNSTVIERNVTVGSGCNLIAPITVGEGATIGAGSTIAHDVPSRKLTIARAPQTVVEHWRGPRRRRKP